MQKVCSVDGCERTPRRGAMCDMHYQRVKKTGTTDPGHKAHMPLEQRFWRYVKKGEPDACWEWSGYLMPNGYARIAIGAKSAGAVSAHRFSCELHHGPAPFLGAHVMHKCDNRACVNPAHLRWGSAAENIQDAYDKKRKVSPWVGENHPFAKLNAEKVRFVRANTQMKAKELAELVGCSRSAISAIRLGKVWKHIGVEECP